MKSRALFLILLSALSLSCNDDDYPYSEVPSVVLNEFWARYPQASDAEFSQSGDTYEVEFEIENKNYKTLIASSGSILKEKKEIYWNTLPTAVRETLQKEYGENNIKDPELVKLEEEIYYQAEVRRFLLNEKVVLDNSGKKDPSVKYWK